MAASALTVVPDFQQNAYLKASNTDAGDYFGWSVAISGNTLVVGARFEDSAEHNRYGISVGISGDTMLAGAYLEASQDPSRICRVLPRCVCHQASRSIDRSRLRVK